MTRLIDADALRENLQFLAYDDWNQGVSTTWAHAYSEIADMINDQPSVDAAHVRHGKWIEHYRINLGGKLNDYIECSECWVWFVSEDMLKRSYCPNCGARMDVE